MKRQACSWTQRACSHARWSTRVDPGRGRNQLCNADNKSGWLGMRMDDWKAMVQQSDFGVVERENIIQWIQVGIQATRRHNTFKKGRSKNEQKNAGEQNNSKTFFSLFCHFKRERTSLLTCWGNDPTERGPLFIQGHRRVQYLKYLQLCERV